MSESSGLLLAELVAPALAVALSPIPVVLTLVLLIHNDRPRASSIAYLLGRATALTALAVAILGAPGLRDAVHRPLPQWTDWIVVAIGAVFIVLGVRAWRHRGDTGDEPDWQSRIGGIPPPVSAAIGLFPALANPKILAASVAADSRIATLTSTTGTAAALACYVALASSTVAAPIVMYLVIGPRIDPKLEHLRHWIARRQNAVTTATLVIVGVAVLLYGLS
jgi:hypothetical protein